MTNDQKQAIAEYLRTLNGQELAELRNAVDEQIQDQYWCDANFFMRDEPDSYIYITRYKDGTYYYDYLGKRAYDRYMESEDAIRIDYKTKNLFPTYGTLLTKESYAR